MTLFNSSCFLCCSIPSFGVSTTSPKKSSSFNMSPTSAIIFIKFRNRDHMKNNIRYKDHINNTSVLIFLNWRTKTPSDSNLLGRTSSEVFVMLVVVVHSFLLLFFSHFCSLFCCCCSSFIFFQRHPSPFCGQSPDFYTHFILSAQLIPA